MLRRFIGSVKRLFQEWRDELREHFKRWLLLAPQPIAGHFNRNRIDRLPKPHRLGRAGEKHAAIYLRRKRYRIVASSVRDRLGEIDLIALDRGTIVFVEVKTRTSDQKGSPLEAVDLAKQRRLTRAALHYLARRRLLGRPSRFDVIAVTWPDRQSRPEIRHVVHAFESPERWQMFR